MGTSNGGMEAKELLFMPEPVATQDTTNAAAQPEVNPNPTLLGADLTQGKTNATQADSKVNVDGDSKSPDQQKADADKAAADKKDGEKKAVGAPEKYEFKPIEGVQIDPEGLTQLETLSKELNLSQEQAQKVLDLGAGQVKKVTDQVKQANQVAWDKQRDSWKAELKKDPEVGGSEEAFKLSHEKALRAVRFANIKGLTDVFESGWGDNPSLFKAFVKFGDALGEDRTIDGEPVGAGVKSDGDVIYGK